jgi:hypothetical protein
MAINNLISQDGLAYMIFDAERRLGSYLASDGNEKTDVYAQKQIKLIKQWTEELNQSLIDQPKEVKTLSGRGTAGDPYKYPKRVEELQGIAIGTTVYFTMKAYRELDTKAIAFANRRGLHLVGLEEL